MTFTPLHLELLARASRGDRSICSSTSGREWADFQALHLVSGDSDGKPILTLKGRDVLHLLCTYASADSPPLASLLESTTNPLAAIPTETVNPTEYEYATVTSRHEDGRWRAVSTNEGHYALYILHLGAWREGQQIRRRRGLGSTHGEHGWEPVQEAPSGPMLNEPDLEVSGQLLDADGVPMDQINLLREMRNLLRDIRDRLPLR